MRQWVWNKIEVRVVCIVDELEIDYESRVPNIFEVVDYSNFMNGNF